MDGDFNTKLTTKTNCVKNIPREEATLDAMTTFTMACGAFLHTSRPTATHSKLFMLADGLNIAIETHQLHAAPAAPSCSGTLIPLVDGQQTTCCPS